MPPSRPDASQALPTRRHLFLVWNPTAGGRRRRQFERTLAALDALGVSVEVRPTRRRGDAERHAACPAAREADAVVAAGGDGTINEVINGLAVHGEAAPPLGIVPLGTANVLAGELGLPGDARAIAEVLAHGCVRTLYPGIVNGRRFAMMVGAGFDAHVVAALDLRLKRIIGKLAYGIGALAQLRAYRPVAYRVAVDGQVWDVASVIVAKGRFYGGRFVCAPEARLTDPILHVCLFPRIGRWNTLRYAAAVLLGVIHRLPDYRIVTADRITIDGPVGEVVQADGDITARLPLTISLSPQPLSVLVG